MALLITRAASNAAMEVVWLAHPTTLHMRADSIANITIINSSKKKVIWASLRASMRKLQWMRMRGSMESKLMHKYYLLCCNACVLIPLSSHSFPCSPNGSSVLSYKTLHLRIFNWICVGFCLLCSDAMWMLNWDAKTCLILSICCVEMWWCNFDILGTLIALFWRRSYIYLPVMIILWHGQLQGEKKKRKNLKHLYWEN